MTVLDCFGGVGLGAFDCAWMGGHHIAVELELRFVELANRNYALWQKRFGHLPTWGSVRIVQGDSRRLGTVLSSAGLCVASPPYADENIRNDANYSVEKIEQAKGSGRTARRATWGHNKGSGGQDGYGSTPGNLGNLKATDEGLAMVIASPPYAATATAKNSDGVDLDKQYQTYRAQGGGASFEKFCVTQQKHSQGYGSSDGQLSAMKDRGFDLAIASPPFAESLASDDPEKRGGLFKDPKRAKDKTLTATYGQSDGQLGTMKDRGVEMVVSSPPYESLRMDGGKIAKEGEGGIRPYSDEPIDAWMTTRDQANIGNNRPDDFWAAARQILEQTYAVLSPRAHAIWVCKDFVRAKKRVPFSDQWTALCESVGFKTLHRHHAWLVEQHGAQHHMDGSVDELETRRISFFRRLAENRGSPKIEWEDVICMIKLESK